MVDVTPSILNNNVSVSPERSSQDIGIGGGAASAQNAEKARIWAEGNDNQVERLGGEHSAKGWAEVAEDIATGENVQTIVDNIEDINTIATNIQTVNTVSQSISSINNVSDNMSDINSVGSNITDISAVATISSDVTQVAGIASAVSTVAAHDSDVTLVSDNMASVMTTAASITDVQTVAGIASDVSAVAGIASDVSAVEDIKTDVSAVAANATNINAVNANKTNIDAVAGNNTNITTVATNISNVNTAVTNMAAIIAAPTAAANAANSATNAQKWAEGADSDVTPLGGTHSSKGWADVARQYAESIGAALKYKGSVSTYSALPTTGQEIGDFWNVLDTGKNYAWTGTEWDDVSGIMDLSAYRTAAAQDLIDAGKQDKLTSSQIDATNSGVTSAKVSAYDSHIADLNIHVTAEQKNTWNEKQDALTAGEGIAIESQTARTQYDVSNFSQYNFLTIPFAVLTDTSTTEYVYEFTTGSDLSGTQTIAQSEQFLALEMDEGLLTSYNYSAGITYTYPTTLQTNTKYKCKCVYSGTNRTWYLLENGSYVQMFSFNDNSYWPGYANDLFLGSHSQITTRAFKGVIHLASCTIKQNGTTLWDGATARQGIDFVVNGSPTIVSHTDTRLVISNTQTSAEWGNITGTLSDQTDLQTALNAKQDALPSQTGQSGKFLTTDGTDASWANIPAGVSADGTTIQSVSNVFTTIGVKDQKTSNADKMWTGTKAEYDAIVTKDANTFYHITDDEPNTVSYAKADLSNLTHGLENTICTTPATTTSTATSATPAVVVENYVNGTSWYRVYSDGWCEQGGQATANQSVSLLKTYSDADYTAVIAESRTTTYGNGVPLIVNKTASGFSVHPFYGDFGEANWVAMGYIA